MAHELKMMGDEGWVDSEGIEHAFCHICGVEVTTHPHAGQLSMEFCGDCGRPTCADHRAIGTAAARCTECQK